MDLKNKQPGKKEEDQIRKNKSMQNQIKQDLAHMR